MDRSHKGEVQCTGIITLACLIFELVPFVVFHTCILSGACSSFTTWGKTGVSCDNLPFLFHNVFYAICILQSFNGHISVVVCSFFEFGTVPKWRIREWVKTLANHKFTVAQILKFFRVENFVAKEKMLVTSIFFFSHNVKKISPFYPQCCSPYQRQKLAS